MEKGAVLIELPSIAKYFPYAPHPRLAFVDSVPYNVVNGVNLRDRLIAFAKGEMWAKGNSNKVKNVYNSIKEAPKYPKGFKAVKNGTKKVNVKNKDVLNALREIEPGNWKKVYKDGYDASGRKISIHYFLSPSGRVFDAKVKSGWSNQ